MPITYQSALQSVYSMRVQNLEDDVNNGGGPAWEADLWSGYFSGAATAPDDPTPPGGGTPPESTTPDDVIGWVNTVLFYPDVGSDDLDYAGIGERIRGIYGVANPYVAGSAPEGRAVLRHALGRAWLDQWLAMFQTDVAARNAIISAWDAVPPGNALPSLSSLTAEQKQVVAYTNQLLFFGQGGPVCPSQADAIKWGTQVQLTLLGAAAAGGGALAVTVTVTSTSNQPA